MFEHADRIVGLYQRHALAWAAARAKQGERRPGDRPMEAAWLDRFLAVLPPRAAVLDLGCGSGAPIGSYLHARGCFVTGVDTAPAMIELCRARLPDQEWCVADMRALSLRRTFAGILAWDSFFHLHPDDQRRMFPVFRAHAAAGTTLMFTSGPDHGVAMGTFEGEPLFHASLSGAEYRTLLVSNGFDVVAHAVEDPTCGGHTIWLARHR